MSKYASFSILCLFTTVLGLIGKGLFIASPFMESVSLLHSAVAYFIVGMLTFIQTLIYARLSLVESSIVEISKSYDTIRTSLYYQRGSYAILSSVLISVYFIFEKDNLYLIWGCVLCILYVWSMVAFCKLIELPRSIMRGMALSVFPYLVVSLGSVTIVWLIEMTFY